MLNSNKTPVRANNSTTCEKTQDAVVGYIYETSDFSQFTQFADNRKINAAHVRKIKEGIKAGKTNRLENLLVIQMNDGSKVVGDGNHRLKAAIELSKNNYPVKLRYYVLKEDSVLEQEKSVGEFIQRINNDRDDWPLSDMIKFFSNNNDDKERKESYQMLWKLHQDGDFFPDSKQNWRYIACILSNGKSQASALKKGLFRTDMTKRQFEYYYKKIFKIADALGVVMKNNFVETFIGAWFYVKGTAEYDEFIDAYGFDEFIDRLKNMEVDTTVTDSLYWRKVLLSAVSE